MRRHKILQGIAVWAAMVLLQMANVATACELTPIEELGKKIFFDSELSNPLGQSCAACHGPNVGFTGPNSAINLATAVYPGAVSTRFGNRKPPTAAYGGLSPVLYFDDVEGLWLGGMFYDGRATGWSLGDPLAEQALGPFLNPLEQNLFDARTLVNRVAHSPYARMFKQVWGRDSLDLDDVAGAYEKIGRSIAAYERSAEVTPYSSKYDYYLAGLTTLTKKESLGLALFEDPLKGNCAACHPSALGENGESPLFTDFSYDNLGVPKNPKNPFYKMPSKYNPLGANWVDLGLGGFLKSAGYAPDVYVPEQGKFKVSTLRNVDKRVSTGFIKAYGHNGYFKSLKDIVHFYNTRDVAVWPAPEYEATVNHDELGNLGLTGAEEDAIVAFLKTLSDGYRP